MAKSLAAVEPKATQQQTALEAQLQATLNSEHELLTQELRTNEAYLAEAQRLSHTGSFGWKTDTGELVWSDETYRIWEFDHAVKPTIDLVAQRVHPEDRPDFLKVIESASAGATRFEHTYRLLLPDGSVKHVHALAHALQDVSGNHEFVGAATDVTWIKRAEEELRTSEAYLAEAQRLSQTGSWAWNPATYEITHWSEECYRIFGFEPGEPLPPYKAVLQRIYPEDQIAFSEHSEKVIRERVFLEHDFRILHPKRGIRNIRSVGRAVLSPSGDIAEFMGTVIDITERTRAEQELQQLVEENVRLEERTRIAQELHDTLLQTFQSASLYLGAMLFGVAQDSLVRPQLDRILEIMRQGIAEGRSAIQGLRSSGSPTSDLVVALSRIQEELEVLPDIDFRVTVTGRQRQLPREVQDEIYRIGKEALGNAFCHSGAKRVELELEYSDTEVHIRIRDNGSGIDSQVLEKGRDGHWGLVGMRERATRIGGLLKILSSATGTEIELSLPLM